MRIGTRGSELALVQANWVASRIGQNTEIVTITTTGDRGLRELDKARWVSELEHALLAGEIDIAVHSAKDVPAELPEGLELLGFSARLDARDVICGVESLPALPEGARVGTSSLRRAAQLRALRADLEVVAVRGNVDTRLRKLAEGQADALVLALAGLERLGRGGEVGAVLDELVPAAGQGALAIEARSGESLADSVAGALDPGATACVNAERELVRVLQATCNTPVGAHAAQCPGSEELELEAWVGLPDGSMWISDRLRGPAAGLGRTVAERLLKAGARELLDQAERMVLA
jgi:hydroxymethylbilane synthase